MREDVQKKASSGSYLHHHCIIIIITTQERITLLSSLQTEIVRAWLYCSVSPLFPFSILKEWRGRGK